MQLQKSESKQSNPTNKSKADGQHKDSSLKAADLRDNIKLKKKANRKIQSLGLLSDHEQISIKPVSQG